MTKEICEGGEVVLTEASLEEAIEKRNWILLVNDQMSFHCFVNARGKKCPHSPFK